MSAVEQVPAHEWEDWLEASGGMLLDVREPHEWQLGVLPGALMISMRELVGRHLVESVLCRPACALHMPVGGTEPAGGELPERSGIPGVESVASSRVIPVS